MQATALSPATTASPTSTVSRPPQSSHGLNGANVAGSALNEPVDARTASSTTRARTRSDCVSKSDGLFHPVFHGDDENATELYAQTDSR